MQNDKMHDLIVAQLSAMSAVDFLSLGVDGLAYIRPMVDKAGNASLYAVYAADGTEIATGSDIAILRAIAMRQNLVPMTVQ